MNQVEALDHVNINHEELDKVFYVNEFPNEVGNLFVKQKL